MANRHKRRRPFGCLHFWRKPKPTQESQHQSGSQSPAPDLHQPPAPTRTVSKSVPTKQKTSASPSASDPPPESETALLTAVHGVSQQLPTSHSAQTAQTVSRRLSSPSPVPTQPLPPRLASQFQLPSNTNLNTPQIAETNIQISTPSISARQTFKALQENYKPKPSSPTGNSKYETLASKGPEQNRNFQEVNSTEIPKPIPETSQAQALEEEHWNIKQLNHGSNSKPTRLSSASRQSIIRKSENQVSMHEKLLPEMEFEGNEKMAISQCARSSPSEEKCTLQKGVTEDIMNLVQTLANGNSNKPGSEHAISIITLAGDNKGASMRIGNSAVNSEDYVPIRRGNYYNWDDIETYANHAERKGEEKDHKKRGQATDTSINSNTQSINNSILQNSSCGQRDTGVHVAIKTKPSKTIKSKEMVNPGTSYKVDSITNQAQEQTYKPIVRRRCLRGLFMESSETDTENHPKPRRHGCRYSCDVKQTADIGKDGS